MTSRENPGEKPDKIQTENKARKKQRKTQQPTEIKLLDIEYIIKWLDEIWLDEEVRKVIDEDEWLKFMESLKEGL